MRITIDKKDIAGYVMAAAVALRGPQSVASAPTIASIKAAEVIRDAVGIGNEYYVKQQSQSINEETYRIRTVTVYETKAEHFDEATGCRNLSIKD